MEKQNSYGCERAITKLSMKGMTITRVILPSRHRLFDDYSNKIQPFILLWGGRFY
jgi:hypothetical protein